MRKPLILINLKKLEEDKALLLLDHLNKAIILLNDRYEIAIAIQPGDAVEISKKARMKIFIHDMYLEHPLYEILNFDFITKNRIFGILTNHPENKLPEKILNKNYHCARNLKLNVIIGSTSIYEASLLNDVYFPDYMAIENMALIGKNLSIREKCAGIVENAVVAIPNRVLFGAGVRNSNDVNYVIKNGGCGILLSSIIVGAVEPLNALLEILELNTVQT
jgi:triosephosphate isomerase